ncbi:hypothetical protein AVEN_222459-1 [Araneus ventricosus]|uniref:Uncharacterized protein n=1 Tax=Araneus ventricosus TaxID=182803 RepID=A0A4Y2UIW6_ARAVE|nr:hypothetical protein AVEN_99420-1 [Araneus ventricosus]GBO12073.1 hypothetical protein AVEN_222459-1 [Araneus ventricosus]
MDPPTNDSRVAPEGSPALMDFEECVTDEELCQFLSGAAKMIAFQLKVAEAANHILEQKNPRIPKSEAFKAEMRNDIKEAREKIAVLQDQVSSTGFLSYCELCCSC